MGRGGRGPGAAGPGREVGELKGFSLVEALVALAVLALVLLLGLGVVWQQKSVILRLEAREEADRALSEALETLRSGAEPPASGVVPVASAPAGAGAAEGLTVVVRVSPAEPPPGLYRAQVVASYRVAGRHVTRTLETQMWRPELIEGH